MAGRTGISTLSLTVMEAAAETLATLRPATAEGVGDQRLVWAEELAPFTVAG